MGYQPLPPDKPSIKKEREGMGMVPPQIVPPLRRRETQLKEEHPMQEMWDCIDAEEDSRIVEWPGGKRERIVPPAGLGGIAPIPRANPSIIAEEYR